MRFSLSLNDVTEGVGRDARGKVPSDWWNTHVAWSAWGILAFLSPDVVKGDTIPKERYMLNLPDFLELDGDGEICLRGHRIRLIDITARYDEGHPAEAIAIDHYPTLSLP